MTNEPPDKITVFVSSPTVPKAEVIKKEDVWGKYDENHERLSDGMIVARSKQKCEIFGDEVPFKSVTVVCKKEIIGEVIYWLEYVHGARCISKVKSVNDDEIALRSDYQCW